MSTIKEERVRLLVGSPGASTTPIHSPGSSSTPIYSPGASTTPIYSPGSSSTLIYSPGALRNAECSNCKHLLDKITVLEAMLEMYKNPEQHTLNSAALLHEVYNDMGKLDLEYPFPAVESGEGIDLLRWRLRSKDTSDLPLNSWQRGLERADPVKENLKLGKDWSKQEEVFRLRATSYDVIGEGSRVPSRTQLLFVETMTAVKYAYVSPILRNTVPGPATVPADHSTSAQKERHVQNDGKHSTDKNFIPVEKPDVSEIKEPALR
ncbi:hypothetical protein Tco_0753002 [Tanacetum coccineum]